MGTALEGLRILDMTQYEAGTSCTQMLAWLGADVVKVESPQGDPGRRSFALENRDSQYFLNYNSNKRSIVLDLKHPRGRDLLLRLLPRFDVFVENYGPGVMESLKLSYDVMREIKPSIIYARIKGYGLSGPYANWKCFDPLAQAASGAYSVTGDEGGPPVPPGPTMADSGTGMQMALAITAAWAQKLRTGEGQQIEVSMQESMTMFMRTIGVGTWGQQAARRRGTKGGAPTGLYPCAPRGANDYVYMLVSNTRMWDQLCVAIGREDLLHEERFQSGRSRIEHSSELEAEITAWTTQHTKFEAMRILCEGGVAASAVFDTMEVYKDPHLTARGFFQTVAHPSGDITLMTSPIRMSNSPVSLRAAPLLGANTAGVLGEELDLAGTDIQALAAAGVIALGEPSDVEGS